MASSANEMIVPLYSALMRPLLEYYMQVWGLQHRKVMKFLEKVSGGGQQIRSKGWSTSPVNISEGAGFILEGESCVETSLWLTKGVNEHEGNQLFTLVDGDRIRENGFKLKKVRFRLDIRGESFTERLVRCWKRLPTEIEEAPSPGGI